MVMLSLFGMVGSCLGTSHMDRIDWLWIYGFILLLIWLTLTNGMGDVGRHCLARV